jgi:flagellar assembly factor FliW
MTMMQQETARPAIVLDPAEGNDDVVEFTAGLPGFPSARRFRIEDLGPDLAPFCRIRSLDEPAIAFTVVPPGTLFPEYSIEIDDERVAQLDLESSEDVITLVIVTTQPAPQPPTANLLGPIIINRANHAAAQVVQHRSSYGVSEPIPLPA